MKGVVFNLLQQVVTEAHGPDVWDDLLDNSDLVGAYTSLGSYPDEEMEALLAAACEALSKPRGEILRWFGAESMPLLAKAYPNFFTPHTTSRTFLAGINNVIHAEVRKLYTGAACPHFHIGQTEAGGLTMEYRSTRRMCALAQGFVEGAARYYCEDVAFEHVSCMEDGADRCRFEIHWASKLDAVA